MKTFIRFLTAGLMGMAIAVIWTGCSVKPQPQVTEIQPGTPDNIKRTEILERVKFELDTAKANLARRKCSATAGNVEAGRRILKENIPAAETLPKTRFVLDELQRVEIQNLEAWATELEKEAQEVGVAEQYRDAREKLRALLAIKEAGLSVEKRDGIELKIRQLDQAYEAQKVKEAIRMTNLEPYVVNREIDQLYREAQHLYDRGRYAEARDKVERILVSKPYEERAIRLMVQISKALQATGEVTREKVFIDMLTVQGWRWALPSTPTLDNFDSYGGFLYGSGDLVKDSTQMLGSISNAYSPGWTAGAAGRNGADASAAFSRTLNARTAAQKRVLEDLASTDEIWIIEKLTARRPGAQAPVRADLLATGKDGELIPIPLQHSSYSVKVAGILAETHVRQTYANPFAAKIEAVYVFPLPDDAAVTDFIMVIGERKIRGLIREREEAKRIYEEARSQGHVAALLTEERPNLFTQKVANIEPGKQIDIDLTYFNTAKYLDGEFELALPTVVGPRYNPAGTTDGVDAVPRGKGCKSPQAVAVEYLAPNERNGHLIDIAVELDPQVAVEKIASSSHEITIKALGGGRSRITLAARETMPNRDFILRWHPAGKPLQTAFWTGGQGDERTFAMLLLPPADEKELPRQPREMIFIVDRSGSMSGQPMAKVQEAMRNCLNGLDGNDTFQIVEFSNQASSFSPAPVPATETNVKLAIEYVSLLDGNGGTEVAAGLKCAFGIPHDPKKLRIVSIMTDGFIGNEMQILIQVKEQLGEARIFAFGVGTSVNRYLIESLAKVGHGAAAFVSLNEDSATVVGQFYRRAAYPALTDVAIDWGKLEVEDVYPKRLPDLFAGRPVLVTGRLKSAIPARAGITVCGSRGGKISRSRIPVAESAVPTPAVCHIWARHKIAQLLTDNAGENTESFRQALTEFSISHTVLCPYTAFLAVDASRITAGDAGHSVNVPVPVPAGVRYDATVLEPEQHKQ
jgi:Ca-activated chloride channel family protein